MRGEFSQYLLAGRIGADSRCGVAPADQGVEDDAYDIGIVFDDYEAGWMVGKIESWREAWGLWRVRSQVQPIEQDLEVRIAGRGEALLDRVTITGEAELV